MTNNKGQAIVETTLFFLLLSLLLGGLCGYTKWVLVRTKLVLAAKEGALLYSSGHMTVSEVTQQVRQFLLTGTPELAAQGITVQINPGRSMADKFLNIDHIIVQYTRPGGWYRWLGADPKMEESCTIKHAPKYWAPLQPWGGPAIS